MNPCLMIFHARDIPECLSSYETLPIDRAYFTGFTEKQLEKPVAEFIETTYYSHYWLVSDDVIATRDAFDKVSSASSKLDVVTGYAFNPDGTICLQSAPIKDSFPHSLKSYHFMTPNEVEASPDPVRTYYVPFILSAIKREVWLEVPFSTYSLLPSSLVGPFMRLTPEFKKKGLFKGWACDYNWSLKLQKKGIEAYAAKGAVMEHLGGSAWRPNRFPLNIGKVGQVVELVKWKAS